MLIIIVITIKLIDVDVIIIYFNKVYKTNKHVKEKFVF